MNPRTTLIAVGVVALLVGGLAGYLYGAGSTPPQTTTELSTVTVTTSDAYEQVASAYATHLAQLDSRNITALAAGYQSNATIEWVGVVPGMTGNYSGVSNIRILWGSFVGKFINFSVSNEYQSIAVGGSASVVNSTFDFRAYSSVVGNVQGSVIAQDVYDHVGASWTIARETWNFTQFDQQFPVG